MAKRLKELVEIIEKWPEERRQDAERMLAALIEQGDGVYELSEAERAAIGRSRAEAERGEFASDEEIAAILRKHGL